MGEPEKKPIAAAAMRQMVGEDGTRRESLLLIETDQVNSCASLMSCSSSCDCLDDERSSLLSVVSRDEGASTCGSCPVCQQLDRKRHELRKHHQAVMKKLMSHRRTSHPELVVADSMSSPKAKSENHLEHHGNPSRPKGLAAATNNVSGGLADSRCHFPFMQIVRTPVNPPRPRVRRLIGEQAKMIGRKIDSSNLQFALGDYSS